MKKRHCLPLLLGGCILFSLSACVDDWGQEDPEAGGQHVVPGTTLATYDFEGDLGDIELIAGASGDLPELSAAEVPEGETDYYGQVLHLNGGVARLANPFKGNTGRTAAMTFYVRQAPTYLVSDEGDSTLIKDLTSQMLSWQTADGTQALGITPNGGLSLQSVLGAIDLNNPEGQRPTGALEPVGDWHWVGLEITEDGYTLYSDGYRRIHETPADFDFAKVVDFLDNAPYLYIGTGATNDLYVDNLTFTTNALTEQQVRDPRVKESGSGDEGDFEYVVGDFIPTIGTPDCQTAWWTAFSNYFRVPANATLRLELTNHTSGGGNWNNWNLCLATDAERGGDGYMEYFVVRSDLYGWGEAYGAGTWSSAGYDDWDAFRADMEGANVVLTLSRRGKSVVMDAVATAPNGHVYHETFTTEAGNGDEVMRVFLIADGSYLEMIPSGCSVQLSVPVETQAVGTPDCAAAWWTAFSDYFALPANQTLTLGLTNHTSGGGNWNNWNLCLATDAERGGDGYMEYFVVRSDLYGWGEAYGTGVWTSEGYGDWDAFRADMEGADVTLTVSRSGKSVVMDAVNVAPNGTVYRETFSTEAGNGDEAMRVFLIADGSYLEMIPSRCYLSIPLGK